jgi:hypothetical protein
MNEFKKTELQRFAASQTVPSFLLPAFEIAFGQPRFQKNIGEFTDPEFRSRFGTAVWDRFTIGGITLPDTTVVVAQQQKNIVKTNIIGRDNTVKELISNGDIELIFQGFFLNLENDSPPSGDILALKQVLDQKRTLEIESLYINNELGITEVVVEFWQTQQVRGADQQIPFEIRVSQDVPIELELDVL